MPSESEFLDQLFGGSTSTRKVGEPLRRAKVPSVSEYLGIPEEEKEAENSLDFVGDAEKFKETFGINFSSTLRSPQKNASVGGKPNSYHLKGTAADIPTAGMTAEDRANVKKYWFGLGGYDVIDEGDHIHVEPGKGYISRTSYGSDGAGAAGKKEQSAEEEFLGKLFAPGGTQEKPKPKPAPKEKGFLEESTDAIKDASNRFFNTLWNRLNGSTEEVERRPEEIDFLVKKEVDNLRKAQETLPFFLRRDEEGLAEYGEMLKKQRKFRMTPRMASEQEAEQLAAQEAKEVSRETARIATAEAKSANTGFWGSVWNYIDNPVYGILNKSLPANVAKYVGRQAVRNREDYNKLKQEMRTQQIIDNPGKYDPEVVALAQEDVARREQERKARNPTIAQQWDDLKKAATEHPERFVADFANALIADPEMLVAPVGVGIKPFQVAKTAGAAAKASRVANAMIDAGSTSAALNVGMTAAEAGAANRDLSTSEVATSAGLGFITGAPFGPLFSKGAAARERIRAGKLTEADLENTLRDVAKEDLAVETVIEHPDTVPTDVRTRIEDQLGISNMSAAEKKKWHRRRQAELKRTFEEQSLEADYLQFKADERISRRTQLAEEAEARQAREAAEAEAAKQVEMDLAFGPDPAARRAKFAEDYEKALAARNAADAEGIEAAAIAEDQLRTATAKLDEQEIMYAAMRSDVPEVKRAMNKALQRDAKLRVPKWQRGDVDPKLVARAGAASLFAGTAYALAEKENKEAAAFAAGLAGLMLPGGGNVLRKLSQAGATTLDGDIISLLVKQGKLKVEREASEIMAREAQVIAEAKGGSQKAFKELYDDNAPRIERYINKQLRGVAGRLGISAEDVAQEVFLDAFKQLDSFSGNVPFSAYLTKIAKNKAVDAIRDAQTLKGGRDVSTTSMYSAGRDFGDSASAGHITEGDVSAIKSEVESAAADIDTPENQAIREQSQAIIMRELDKLPERERKVFVLNRIEHYDPSEIAEMMGLSYDNVSKITRRVEADILLAVERGFGAKKSYHGNAKPAEEVIKRGRGRPRKETGEIDPKLLKMGAIAALGAGAGAFLNDENKKLGAAIGAAVGLGLATKGRMGTSAMRQLVDNADYTLGVISTRIMNKSPALWRKAIEHERVVLRDTHAAMVKVNPFLQKLKKLPEETRNILSRAILTGNPEVTNRILHAIGDPELISSWKAVRSTLDSLGDQLVALKRFGKKELDYFPRVVKDVDGLLKALGNERGSFLEEALKEAETKSLRNRGTGLSDLEKSMVINKVLSNERYKGQQPGFAKDRVIEEITPELQKYYASPSESLHTHIRAAVEDIQRAKFFGKDLEVITKKGKDYTNVDASIGNVVNRLMNEGKLSGKDAEEVAGLMRSRFINGERAPGELIQAMKNLSYAGLLGNPFSAATQLGDVIIQAYTQDIRSTINATVRSLTGNKIVNMKDFGLSDHIAEEFATTSRSAAALNKIFKYSFFKGVDEFGKDVALNAAVLRFGRLAKSEKGIQEISRKYASALQPDELNQLVKDLQKGEVTDLVRSIAFAELSRTQPITRLELPQAYLDNPNGRLLYQFKTFMLKQIDVARRDAFNEIKAGNRARGIKNLTELGIALGVAGTSTSAIKDYMLGKDVDLSASDVPLNMLKTFGLTEYFLDHALGVSKEEAAERRAEGDTASRAVKAEPVQTTLNMFAPAPAQVLDTMITGDPKLMRYVPIIGPILYEQYKADKEKASE